MGKVAVDSLLVNSLFKCPLCHGLVRSPTVINECLHRFCRVCITNHFENNNHNNQCPTCQISIVNPLETLKSDLIFQRLLYKIFPSVFQREITWKPSLLSPASVNDLTRIYIDSTIDVYLEYWDISLDLFPNSKNSSAATLPPCYLECKANTPLSLLEKFIRVKHSLSPELKIDIFYKTFLLNTNNEKLIDVCYCFDRMTKGQALDIRFLVSPYGYNAILNHIHQLKHPVKTESKVPDEPAPLQIEVTPEKEIAVNVVPSSSSSSSSSSSLNSIDPKLKVKIRRSQTSNNDWYIPQSKKSDETADLPDLVNSCETPEKTTKRKQPSTNQSTATPAKKKSCAASTFFSPGHMSNVKRSPLTKSITKSVTKPLTKPQRRTRFIPTMVKAPPSIFDRLLVSHYDYSDPESDESPLCATSALLENSVTTLRPSETVSEGNTADSTEAKRAQKTVCKVPPYVPESSSAINSSSEKSLSIVKPTPVYPTLSPTRRTLIPKKFPTMMPTIASRDTSLDSNNTTPLDLSLK